MKQFLIILALSIPCLGQAWSGILTPARAIDWTTAGLPSSITYGTGGSPCNGSLANCVETTANPWTLPTRVQCGSTVAAGASPATINADIAACSPGSYVLLGAGSFSINADLSLHTNGVSLRGSGANSTFLTFSGTANVTFGVSTGVATAALGATSYTSGTSSLTITGSTFNNPSIGQIALVAQCATGWTGTGLDSFSDVSCTSGSYSDPGTIWICGVDDPTCSSNLSHTGNNVYQNQFVRITSVSGTCSSSCVIGFTPGLYMPNWSSSNNGRFLWTGMSNWSYGNGIEDLTARFADGSTERIDIEFAYGWWVKGLRIIGNTSPSSPQKVSIGGPSAQGLFANNYVFGEDPLSLGTATSEPIVRNMDTGTLMLNNIVTGGVCFWGGGHMVAEVGAYNYCRDSQTPYNAASIQNHDPDEEFGLYEGNSLPQSQGDNIHGTNNLQTYFRNYEPGYDAPYVTDHAYAMLDGNFNRFFNHIGNSLGGPLSNTYQGSDDKGKIYTIPSDALTLAGWLRWGNCDTVTATCRFVSSEVPNSTTMPAGTYPNATAYQNTTPASNNLPCSFFMPGAFTTSPCAIKPSGGTGLSWWKVCTNWTTFPTSCASSTVQPFPPVGPDQSGGTYVNGTAYDNPAAIAYKYLPIDTSLQNSLTITASSWSSNPATCQIVSGASGITATVAPCEILTVSFASIDNGSAEHIMGGFQLSGVAAGCIPAGINFATLYGNNEVMMTGSTTTQVAYSLPSSSPDNGSSNQCTGTLLFPNIRKFDERVYQLDSSLSPANTPTFSPVAGTYTGTQSVTLSSTSAGAVICYNTTGSPATNGTTGCTTGTLYTSPVSVAASETLFAVAGGTGFTDSSVGSAAYTINSPVGAKFTFGIAAKEDYVFGKRQFAGW